MRLIVKAAHRDRLRGGRADKRKPGDFDAKQLAAGASHELEHTDDRALAQEIAMDHLAEDPDYYKKLKRIEKAGNRLIVKSAGPRYRGPRTVADVNLAAWMQFFREGGALNQPYWLQSDRLEQLRKQFALLANMHRED